MTLRILYYSKGSISEFFSILGQQFFILLIDNKEIAKSWLMSPNELIYGLVLAENLEYLYPFFIFVELNFLYEPANCYYNLVHIESDGLGQFKGYCNNFHIVKKKFLYHLMHLLLLRKLRYINFHLCSYLISLSSNGWALNKLFPCRDTSSLCPLWFDGISSEKVSFVSKISFVQNYTMVLEHRFLWTFIFWYMLLKYLSSCHSFDRPFSSDEVLQLLDRFYNLELLVFISLNDTYHFSSPILPSIAMNSFLYTKGKSMDLSFSNSSSHFPFSLNFLNPM